MVVKCQYLTLKVVSGQALNIIGLWVEVVDFSRAIYLFRCSSFLPHVHLLFAEVATV